MSGDQSLLKRLNRMSIVRHVKAHPGVARGDLADLTGLADSTISVLVKELIGEGWLRASDSTGSGGVGRRPKLLALDPDRIAVLGAEMGVDYLNVVACSLRGEVLFSRMTDYRHGEVAASARDLAALIVEARAAMLARRRRLLGVGVGVPGMVTTDGLLRFAPAIGWRDVAVGDEVTAALRQVRCTDLPVTVLNDANAAALSEYVFGASPAISSLVFLILGFGVGAGIVLHGRLHLGHDGLAGEVGHTIVQPGGLPCACGRRGCAETLLSQKAMSRLATGRDEPILHVAELVERLARRDEALTRGAREAGALLGFLVHNLIVSLNPEVVILGGPLSRLDVLVAGALERLAQLSGDRPYHHAEVRACPLGLNATAVGAAGSVLNTLLQVG
ncbi:MAG: ROK family transcriptional regulator [Anaeromyxobacter sp.]|nr:ROK family transcriptional regulator [Anaeromyxobacter sp.]